MIGSEIEGGKIVCNSIIKSQMQKQSKIANSHSKKDEPASHDFKLTCLIDESRHSRVSVGTHQSKEKVVIKIVNMDSLIKAEKNPRGLRGMKVQTSPLIEELIE